MGKQSENAKSKTNAAGVMGGPGTPPPNGPSKRAGKPSGKGRGNKPPQK